MNNLYRLNGSAPAPLPTSFTPPDGYTRTHPDQWTPEEIAEWGFVEGPAKPEHDPATQQVPVWDEAAEDWRVDALPPPPEPEILPLALHQVAAAQLQVTDWDVTGVERSQGIAIAFMLDTDLLYVQLTEEQPDDTYIVLPSDGVSKFPDHVEVSRPGLTNVSFIIQRVQ